MWLKKEHANDFEKPLAKQHTHVNIQCVHLAENTESLMPTKTLFLQTCAILAGRIKVTNVVQSIFNATNGQWRYLQTAAVEKKNNNNNNHSPRTVKMMNMMNFTDYIIEMTTF